MKADDLTTGGLTYGRTDRQSYKCASHLKTRGATPHPLGLRDEISRKQKIKDYQGSPQLYYSRTNCSKAQKQLDFHSWPQTE